jgi:TetR/AcrR family transcriptional regulator
MEDVKMDNRTNILRCALRLFATRGYDAVGVQEIVEAAGVTKPTLYHYFGSKLGLLETLVVTYSSKLIAQLKVATVYQGDIHKSLNEIMDAYFEFAERNRLYYRFQLAMWFSPPYSELHKTISPINEQQREMIESIFLAAVEQHGNMRGRHSAFAATYLGLINTYIGLYLNGYVELSDEIKYKAQQQFKHGIFS